MPSTAVFLDLPDEVVEILARRASPLAFAALRATCRHLRRLLVFCVFMCDPLNACAFPSMWSRALGITWHDSEQAAVQWNSVEVDLSAVTRCYEVRRAALFGADDARLSPYVSCECEWPEVVCHTVLDMVMPMCRDVFCDIAPRIDIWHMFFRLVRVTPVNYALRDCRDVLRFGVPFACETERYAYCQACDPVDEPTLHTLRAMFLPFIADNLFTAKRCKSLCDAQRDVLCRRACFFYKQGKASMVELAATLLLCDRGSELSAMFPSQVWTFTDIALSLFTLLVSTLASLCNRDIASTYTHVMRRIPSSVVVFLREQASCFRAADVLLAAAHSEVDHYSAMSYILACIVYGHERVADALYGKFFPERLCAEMIQFRVLSLYVEIEYELACEQKPGLDIVVRRERRERTLRIVENILVDHLQGCFGRRTHIYPPCRTLSLMHMLCRLRIQTLTHHFIRAVPQGYSLPVDDTDVDYFVTEEHLALIQNAEWRNSWILRFACRRDLTDVQKARVVPLFENYYDWRLPFPVGVCLCDDFVRDFRMLAERLVRLPMCPLDRKMTSWFFKHTSHLHVVHALRNRFIFVAENDLFDRLTARIHSRYYEREPVDNQQLSELLCLLYPSRVGEVEGDSSSSSSAIRDLIAHMLEMRLDTHYRAAPALVRLYLDLGGQLRHSASLKALCYCLRDAPLMRQICESETLSVQGIRYLAMEILRRRLTPTADVCSALLERNRTMDGPTLPGYLYSLCMYLGMTDALGIATPSLEYCYAQRVCFQYEPRHQRNELVAFLRQYPAAYWDTAKLYAFDVCGNVSDNQCVARCIHDVRTLIAALRDYAC